MFRHLSSALLAIRRSPYQALSALLILFITFFVGFVFSLFVYSTEHILHYFETRPQITAFFKLNSTPDDINLLRQTMLTKPYVDKANVITKDQALQIYREDNKKDPLLLELVTADILPASIEVSAKDAESLGQIKTDLSQDSHVDEVVYQKDVIETLQKWTQSVRYVGIASIAILSITSFLIIVIVTGMKVAGKKRAIQTMRILGASRWYVSAPFVLEGMIYGFLGSCLGWIGMYIGLLYLTPWLKTFLGNISLLPIAPEFFMLQFGAGTLLALLLGALASSLSVRRMMKRT